MCWSTVTADAGKPGNEERAIEPCGTAIFTGSRSLHRDNAFGGADNLADGRFRLTLWMSRLFSLSDLGRWSIALEMSPTECRRRADPIDRYIPQIREKSIEAMWGPRRQVFAWTSNVEC